MNALFIDAEVMQQIANHGTLKGLDPYLLHVLKTSQDPLLRARRNWIYEEGYRQAKQAEIEQKKINDAFKEMPVARAAPVRRRAVVHPYYMAKEAKKHKASWNDPDFLKATQRDNPEIFPKRTP